MKERRDFFMKYNIPESRSDALPRRNASMSLESVDIILSLEVLIATSPSVIASCMRRTYLWRFRRRKRVSSFIRASSLFASAWRRLYSDREGAYWRIHSVILSCIWAENSIVFSFRTALLSASEALNRLWSRGNRMSVKHSERDWKFSQDLMSSSSRRTFSFHEVYTFHLRLLAPAAASFDLEGNRGRSGFASGAGLRKRENTWRMDRKCPDR